ncbi:MAG: hypothetical protein IJ246_04585 [Clostridia bacterium]|nr:hypothetical protein [Clostridia bacterium]
MEGIIEYSYGNAEKAEGILSVQTVQTPYRIGEFRREASETSKRLLRCYILGTTQIFDKQLFEEALAATAEHRGSTELIEECIGIIERIAENYDLRNIWKKYRQRFSYASEIEYEDIIRVLKELLIG